MKFGHLMALVASVESGGIRAGARRLGVSQAAVTRSLKELEEQVGVSLIVRSSRGIQLTAHGEVVYDRASTMANQMARLANEIGNMRAADGAVVSFNVPVVLAMTILPPVIEKLQKVLPNTHFSIGEGNISSALPMLRNGELDFIISLTNGKEVGSEFTVLPLLHCEARLVARKGHRLGNARSIDELLDADWILTPDDEMTRGGTHYFFREFGLPMPRCTVRCRTTAVGLPMVYAGDSIAIMAVPLLKLNFLRDLVDVIPVTERLPLFTYSLISRSDIPLSSSASQICRFLKRHSQQWGFVKPEN
jgi:DNA-binding transcriptional LysR family regulator